MAEITPWDWQWDIIEQVRKAIRARCRKILVVVPTGGGKTVIAAQIVKLAAQKFRRCQFLAHRRELIYQCANKLERFGVDHGMIMAGEYPYGAADCQVSSIDTLRARCITAEKMPLPNSDVVIIDEAHRSLAPTYITLINHYGDRVVIGLTATPIRGDGKGLGHIYDHMVVGPSIEWMVAHGYLVPTIHYAPTMTDLTGIPIKGGDYDKRELERAMDRRSLVGGIVEHWFRLAHDRPTIVFASGVKHSIHLRDEFVKAGTSAAHIDGDTALDERKQIIADLHVGKVQVVCNYAVLTEGFDEPKLSANVIARPTKNLGLYLQMGGRTLRPFAGKEDSLLIDHSGNIYEHGFIEDERHWVLEEGRALTKSNSERQRDFDERDPITCVKCATVYTGQLPCPSCGYTPQKKGRWVESRSGDLMEVRAEKRRTAKKRTFSPKEKQSWYRQLQGYALEKNKSDKWVAAIYKAKFKEWPKSSWSGFKPEETSGEVRGFIRHRNIAYAKRKQAEERGRQQDQAAGR